MKVTHLGQRSRKYPYQYRIEMPCDRLHRATEVRDWVMDTGFRCCMVPGAVYVPDLKDVTMFLLRWS